MINLKLTDKEAIALLNSVSRSIITDINKTEKEALVDAGNKLKAELLKLLDSE